MKNEINLSDIEVFYQDEALAILGFEIKTECFATFDYNGNLHYCEYDRSDVINWIDKNKYDVQDKENCEINSNDISNYLHTVPQEWRWNKIELVIK